MLYYEYKQGDLPWKFRKDMVNFMKKRIAMLLSGLLALSLLTFSMTSCLEEGTPEDEDDEDDEEEKKTLQRPRFNFVDLKFGKNYKNQD